MFKTNIVDAEHDKSIDQTCYASFLKILLSWKHENIQIKYLAWMLKGTYICMFLMICDFNFNKIS